MRSQTPGEGLSAGGGALGWSLLEGFGGVVGQPIREHRAKGMRGIPLGIAKGLIGYDIFKIDR